MYQGRIFFAFFCISICSALSDRQKNVISTGNSQGKNTKLPSNYAYQSFTTVTKQWKCVNGACEESVTTCHNDVCDTKRNFFTSEKNQPEDGKLKLPENYAYQTFTTVRKQWKCVNGDCEETITKCQDNICDTTKNYFKSEKNQPENQRIENSPTPLPVPVHIPVPEELMNHVGILKVPQPPPADVKTPYNNTGLIDMVTTNNAYNYAYYWSNSKHIDKKCHNNLCYVTTKTCINGKCEEKTVTETL